MTVFKVRRKSDGRFIGGIPSLTRGRIYNQRNHISSSFGKDRLKQRTDIEIVEFELVEKKVHEPKNFYDKETKPNIIPPIDVPCGVHYEEDDED